MINWSSHSRRGTVKIKEWVEKWSCIQNWKYESIEILGMTRSKCDHGVVA